MGSERRDRYRLAVARLSVGVCLAGPLMAQSTSVAADSTRLIASSEHVRVVGEEGVRLAVLDKTIALNLDDVPLSHALEAIARQAGLKVVYGNALVTDRRRVSLQAANITVTDALTVVLRGTDLDALVSVSGAMALVRHGQKRMAPGQQGGGTVGGRVTDAVTRAPLDQVAIRVEGPGLGAVTTSDGRYTVRSVPPGTYHVTARRVGYMPLTETVTVATDSTAAADFALAVVATKLNEVVTTASGDQRRLEVGNVIATINADSIAKTAPVTDLTDLISGRASNVDVESTSGEVGSGPRIRIRGVSSAELSNDPIVIVDGIRADNAPGAVNGAFQSQGYSPQRNVASRLNDIDPSEIESIEILKGPSAATLYGTDAANGVIVITTHRGRAGATQWNVAAEHGGSTIPSIRNAPRYYDWGHSTDGTNTPVDCARTGPSQYTVAARSCAIDSVTEFQPLDNPSTSVFGPGYANRVTGQVSGGSQKTQFFVSGALTDQTGVLRLPSAFAPYATAKNIPLTSNLLRPNTVDQKVAHARLSTSLSSAIDLSLSSGYASSSQNSADANDVLYAAFGGQGYRDSLYQGYEPGPFQLPVYIFQPNVTERLDRFTNGGTLTWHPTSWLSAHGTGGIDLGAKTDAAFVRPGPDPAFLAYNPVTGTAGGGFNAIEHLTTTLYTVDLGVAVTPQLRGAVSSRTAVGFQYNDQRQTGTLASAYGLSQNGSLNGAATQLIQQLGAEAVTLGTYVEETVGYNDRLYLTGALREDAGSGFGRQANVALYPKASASWELWEHGKNTLRLRAAYGASGVQPQSGATYSLYTPVTAIVDHALVTVDTGATIGNQRLKPERQSELETGFDATVLGGRVQLEGTYYNKLSHDALVPVTLPSGGGYLTEQENVGSVRNYGVELSIQAEVTRTRLLSWLINLSGSINTNRLVSLAPGVGTIVGNAANVQYRQQPGYPLFGYWAQRLIYSDTNHDGFIEPGEVSVADSNTFQGQPLPPRQLALNTSLALWGGQLRIGAQVDGRGGNKLFNFMQLIDDYFPGSPALYGSRPASFADQARAEGYLANFITTNPYYSDASFARWRELSVTYLVPAAWTRALRTNSIAVTLAARNLALWTRYSGLDPEATSFVNVGTASFAQLPPDVAEDNGNVPQPRSWLVRINLGW